MVISNHIKRLLPFVYISVICILYLTAILLRHYRLESFGYDLGIFSQEIHLLAQGKLPFSTIKIPHKVIWGDHWSPSMALFIPFVWIFKKSELILLASQVIGLAIAAYTIFTIGLKKTKDWLFSCAILFAFTLFYGVQNALFFDFHPLVIGAMLFPLLYLLKEQKRWLLFGVLTFIVANLQENLALYFVFWGIACLFEKRFKLGLILIGLYGVWTCMTLKLFIPHFSPGGGYEYQQSMPNLQTLIIRLFYPFEKIKVVLTSFAQFAILPLFSPFSVFISGYNFLETFLGEGALGGRWEFDRHYKVMLGPILALGAIEGYRWFKTHGKFFPKLRYGMIAGIVGMTLGLQFLLHLQLNLLTKKAYWQIDENKKIVLNIVKKLNQIEASIATQNNIIPHLSNRKLIYLAQEKTGGTCVFHEQEADYLLLDLTPNQSIVNFLGCTLDEVATHTQALVKSGKFKVELEKGNVLLLRKTRN